MFLPVFFIVIGMAIVMATVTARHLSAIVSAIPQAFSPQWLIPKNGSMTTKG